MKRILFTGRATSGSWQIRGVQLGAAVGATVVPRALDSDIAAADLIVVVKRTVPDLLERLRAGPAPIVWDIVDSWPADPGNLWDRFACMSWLEYSLKALNPIAVVAATRAMQADIVELRPDLPCLYVPHHSRPGGVLNSIRESVKRVGYEGSSTYLGDWARWAAEWCFENGAVFDWSLDGNVHEADIVLALRNRDGYAPRHWKSNVKLANAQATGTPIVCAREQGYLETDHGQGAVYADTRLELVSALDSLRGQSARRGLASRLLGDSWAYSLSHVARTYETWLRAL